mmetsp:Transcript_39756/g.112815  ORF Transcript_39756/g.112815 Transcript_39756/m.112815 type:complete len:353 (-) Transcript_39756:758-1816(-)
MLLLRVCFLLDGMNRRAVVAMQLLGVGVEVLHPGTHGLCQLHRVRRLVLLLTPGHHVLRRVVRDEEEGPHHSQQAHATADQQHNLSSVLEGQHQREHNAGDGPSHFACGGRDPMARASDLGRVDLGRDDVGGGVGAEVVEEVGAAVQDDEQGRDLLEVSESHAKDGKEGGDHQEAGPLEAAATHEVDEYEGEVVAGQGDEGDEEVVQSPVLHCGSKAHELGDGGTEKAVAIEVHVLEEPAACCPQHPPPVECHRAADLPGVPRLGGVRGRVLGLLRRVELLSLVHLVAEVQSDRHGKGAKAESKAPGEFVRCSGRQANQHHHGGQQVADPLVGEGPAKSLGLDLRVDGLRGD